MHALLQINPFESVAAPLTDRTAAALTPPSPGAAATNFPRGFDPDRFVHDILRETYLDELMGW